MRLYEEYLLRHSIDEPVIKHVRSGSLFLWKEYDNRTNWRILTINYPKDVGFYHSPPKYTIRLLAPVRNSYDSLTPSFETVQSNDIEWDHYEPFFQEFKNNDYRFNVAKDKAEITLMAWEMFVCILDSKLTSYATNDSFFKSLDRSLPTYERYTAHCSFFRMLSIIHPSYLSVWEDLLRQSSNYCDWLVKLMDCKREGNN